MQPIYCRCTYAYNTGRVSVFLVTVCVCVCVCINGEVLLRIYEHA